MGRMLDTLRQSGIRRAPDSLPETSQPTLAQPLLETESEGIPFIEVGGKLAPVEGSPDVLASPAPRRPGFAWTPPIKVPQIVSPPPLETEPAGLSVSFRPIRPELKPAKERLAAELIAFHKPDHLLSRQYQSLAATLAESLPATRSRVLLFSAKNPGAGVTTVVLNLAITFARQGKQRVLVVDANLNQPAVAERLGLPERPGVADVIAGDVTVQDVVQETGLANLLALTAGGSPLTRGVRLPGEAARSLFKAWRERFDLVLLDAPCWSAQVELAQLASACEAVYFVSPEAEAQDTEIVSLLQTMTRQGIPVRGHLVTKR